MSDISTISRFPNLGKLSVAILEHTIKPIIGEKAIDEIKSPVIEKDLLNSLETILEKAEKQFIAQYADREICEIILNLPLSNLPSVVQAVHLFYSNPNVTTLNQILTKQLESLFPTISSERIGSGVFAYIRFLKDELINLNNDIRSKLGIKATLEMQNNTTKMVEILSRIEKNQTQGQEKLGTAVTIYKRDYTELTTEEVAEWNSIRESEVVKKSGNLVIRKSRFNDYPKAARHFDSLFPNYYLDPVDLKDKAQLLEKISRFINTLNSEDVTERTILNFISEQQAYFIIASVLKEYFHFGHHDTFLFPEFQLGNSYQADYLLVGRSSDGWSFVFIELEEPLGQITLKDGEFGTVFRKGIEQVKNWDVWLEAHYGSLRETFDKYRHDGESLPDEFFTLDKSRINYVVVAGRRDDFSKKTYREQRIMKKNSVLILHYDNLIDTSKNIVGQSTY